MTEPKVKEKVCQKCNKKLSDQSPFIYKGQTFCSALCAYEKFGDPKIEPVGGE